MASTYSELVAEIQSWLDNDNPNLVAAIPSFIQDAENRFNRQLRTLDMHCRAAHVLVPNGVTDDKRGVYALPDNWAGQDSVEVLADDVVLLYYQRIPALNDTTQTTNWLLDKHPDLYRFGALVSAEPWLKNDPRVNTWSQFAGSALEEVQREDREERASGGPVRSFSDNGQFWRTRHRGGQGRYEYMAPHHYYDLVASQAAYSPQPVPGYFSIAAGNLLIWPIPQGDPTADAGWGACT